MYAVANYNEKELQRGRLGRGVLGAVRVVAKSTKSTRSKGADTVI
jgi:hypothetical protein